MQLKLCTLFSQCTELRSKSKNIFAWGRCLQLILDAWGLEVLGRASAKKGKGSATDRQGIRHFGQMVAALELQQLLLLLLLLRWEPCAQLAIK